MATFPVTTTDSSPWTNHRGSLPPEVDVEGNIEYKLKLIATAPDRFEHLVTQLKWRLSEGNGRAIYEIGVADNGSFVGLSPQDMETSLKTLRKMADFLKADVSILRKVSVESTQRHDTSEDGSTASESVPKQPIHSGTPRTKPEYLVVEAMVTSRLADEHHFLEIRVALVGGPDAGKSTLLGRLAHGIADNGRGKARLNLLRHRHEINTGRTSSISHEIMGFTVTGETVNYSTTNISSWQEVCESSAKVVTLLDTCGHPRFLKTTIAGLTGHAPDYACLVVDSRIGGVNDMTKGHLALAVAFGLPTFVVVTKMDVATRDQLRATVTALMTLIQNIGPSCLLTVGGDAGPPLASTQPVNSASGVDGDQPLQKFVPVIVRNDKGLDVAVKRFSDTSIIQETNTVAIPILLLSSVTGENVNVLERFLFLLPKPSLAVHDVPYSQEPACYQIEEIYNIPDIGTVVGGFLHAGRIEVHTPGTAFVDTDESNEASLVHNMGLYLGPVDRDGGFIPVVVKSIHRQRMSMRSIDSGQTATLAIEGPDLAPIKVRRGMVILESDTDPRGTCCQTFEAVIQVLGHDKLFGIGFQGMIHCGSVHQNAKVIKVDLIPSPDLQGDVPLTALDSAAEDLGDSNEPPAVRESRDSNCGSAQSSRSSSPSSDYGSGTGSPFPESASVSTSTLIHQRADNAGSTDDQGSAISDDQQRLQLRSRPRRQNRSKQHGMIPISTMRTFRRLSIKNAKDGTPASAASADAATPSAEHLQETTEEPVMLQAGSRARVVFEFCHDVAFMREGTTLLFRHGRTKCVGKVLRML